MICQAFRCTPAEALEQDYDLVIGMLLMRTYDDLSSKAEHQPKDMTARDWLALDAFEGRR